MGRGEFCDRGNILFLRPKNDIRVLARSVARVSNGRRRAIANGQEERMDARTKVVRAYVERLQEVEVDLGVGTCHPTLHGLWLDPALRRVRLQFRNQPISGEASLAPQPGTQNMISHMCMSLMRGPRQFCRVESEE